MNGAWSNPSGPLKDLAEVVGIAVTTPKDNKQVTTLEDSEWPDALTYRNEEFDGSALARFSVEEIQRFKAVLKNASARYDAAFTFEISKGDRPLLTVGANFNPQTVDDLYARHRNDLDGTVTLASSIDKSALSKRWGFTHDRILFQLFLFPNALARLLSVPLPELEDTRKGLLKDATGAKKLILVVPDHAIALNGDYLAILGGNAVSNWADLLPTNGAAELVKKASDAHDLAKKTLVRWLNFKLHHLTPLQLNVTSISEEPKPDDVIAGAFHAQLFTCSLLYMAVVSIRNENVGGVPPASLWTATFTSDKYRAEFDVFKAEELRETLRKSVPEGPWTAARTIGKFAAWIYEPERPSDRLTILQNVVASTFQDNKASANCGELARMADEIVQRVTGGWATFIGKKLDEYFQHGKDFEETIVAAAKSYDEQVQSLTNTLIANMLAAVAVIVGSFIAAMFKSPFDTKVFTVGALTYFVYLAVFQIGFGLTSTYGRFRQSRDAFAWRRERFKARLPEATVNRIIGTAAPDRQQWFEGWFLKTATAYTIVALLFLAAAFVVPDLMRLWSDDFSLDRVSAGGPAGETIPLVVRGEHFDKDKEIVATVGRATFTNAGSDSLKVLGTTVLTFSPRRSDLATASELVVRQGTAAPKTIRLR